MTARETAATLVATLLVVGAVASVVVLGTVVSPVAADQHTKDQAPDLTEEANFRVQFPFSTDHQPGSQNEENGSIQYFFEPAGAFAELGVENGAYGDYVIIDADWIDYSACDAVQNTAVFGIDRGNNNEGTQIDVDLVNRMKDNNFRTDGLTISFYEFGDLGGEPPYMESDDAVVAEQGARSNGGACLTLTDEPGWYQVQGFLNGTKADNGPDQPPSEDAEMVGGTAKSNYLYVCECEDGQDAREELGPPPNESGPAPTPTPDTPAENSTPTPTDSGPASTPTPTARAPGGPTPTLAPGGGDTPGQATATPGGGGGTGDGGPSTPTLQDGPGFTAVAALLALFVSALLVRRRG